AAALDLGAWFEVNAGHDDAGIELGYEAARVATQARDDGLVASALMNVGYALGFDKQRFDASDVAFEWAQVAAARAGNPGVVLERLYGDRESVLYQRGDHLAVLPLCQVVYALSVKLHGTESYEAALSLGELADAVGQLGDYDTASRLLRSALATGERTLGSEHPIV